MITGAIGALFEVLLYFITAYNYRKYFSLYDIHDVAYYWMTFTILTGIWEVTYIFCKKQVSYIAMNLLKNNEHVWTNKYSIKMVIPQLLARLFYAEYGAYADREYITFNNKWSIVIESTHALCCTTFSTIAIIASYLNYKEYFYMSMSIAMSCQFMNSILYMSQYLIQIRDPNSVNYNTEQFPTGFMLLKRPFMYINIFWTIMPIIVLYGYFS